MPKIGWLSSASPESSVAIPFFKQGLADLDYVEGRNVVIEYAWARSHPERFPSLASGLVRANVAVIAAVSGAPAARAAMAATSVIPIVFITPGDPVQQGLVHTLNRPSANVTGLTMMNTSLAAKQMELMNEVIPAGAAIAVLSDPNIENEELESTARLAGQKLGRRIVIIPTANESDFETAIAALSKEGSVGLVVPDRPLFTIGHNQLAALISRKSIPAVFPSCRPIHFWGSDELRREHIRHVQASGRIRWQNSQRCQACGYAGRAADKDHVEGQSQSCEAARPYASTDPPRPRRRGDRVMRRQRCSRRFAAAGAVISYGRDVDPHPQTICRT